MSAAAMGAFVLVVFVMVLRHQGIRSDWPGSLLGLVGIVWYIDGALRRRTGRIAAAVVSLVSAGLLLFGGTVGIIVLAVQESRFDWMGPAVCGGVAGLLALVGLPLLRPSARAWFARPGSLTTR